MARPIRQHATARTHVARANFAQAREVMYQGTYEATIARMLGIDGGNIAEILVADERRLLTDAVMRDLNFPAPSEVPGEIEALARCWRVEAARADIRGLWESIEDGPDFGAQMARYNEACFAAAEAAVEAWRSQLTPARRSPGR